MESKYDRVDVPQNINVNPIDGGVEISWDPVVYAASHNLYYSLNADFPESCW